MHSHPTLQLHPPRPSLPTFITTIPAGTAATRHGITHHSPRAAPCNNIAVHTVLPLRRHRRAVVAGGCVAPFSCASSDGDTTNSATNPPPSEEKEQGGQGQGQSQQPKSPYLDGTPCFTSRILASPMPLTTRDVYLSSVTEAVNAFLSQSPQPSPQPSATPNAETAADAAADADADTAATAAARVASVTLLVPQLDPSIDVYDRRFLLQLVWSVLKATVSTHSLRARVLIQGRRRFGAIPLSIAGLRRNFDADLQLSRGEWPLDAIRSGDLENADDLDEEDDIVIVVSPTNAISIPVINSVVDLVRRAHGRPVILLNPRLEDVPSHSGIMTVTGRADRIQFLQSVEDIFYLRLLYDPGTSYPPRGILFHAWPTQWQVWRSEKVDSDYTLIASFDAKPDSSSITVAYRADSFIRQKKFRENSPQQLTSVTDVFLKPQFLFFFLVVLAVVALVIYRHGAIDAMQM